MDPRRCVDNSVHRMWIGKMAHLRHFLKPVSERGRIKTDLSTASGRDIHRIKWISFLLNDGGSSEYD